jgi:thiamine-phosphate pyrophosphorylase
VRALPAALLVITDRHQARRPIEAIAAAVGEGGWLLLRDKDMDEAARRDLAARLAQTARRCGLHFSVSRDVDLAAACGASVHLQSAAAVPGARQRLGGGAFIGVSAHGQAEVAAAAVAGADYVTLSPIFLTASKPGYGSALGVAAITPAARVGVPILALGGINAATVGTCFQAGVSGIAVMGEVMRSDEPARTVRALLGACKAATAARDSAVLRP